MSGRFGMVPARAFDDTRMTDSLIAVLGLVATYGNRDGWYGMRLREMAERRGVSKQAISGAVSKLTAYGYIDTRATKRADGGRGWNEYRVLHDVDLPAEFARVPPSSSEVDGVSSPGVDAIQTPGTDSVANATGGKAADGGEVDRNGLFRALAETWTGIGWPVPLNDKSRNFIASALPDLTELGATPAEVHTRAGNYLRLYEKRPTPTALVKHWPALAAPPPKNGAHISIPASQRRAEERERAESRRRLVERLACD